MPGDRTRARRLVGWLVTLTVCAAMAACDDGETSGGGGTEDEEDSRGGGSLTQTHPLTGEAVDGDLPAHPVVTVKVDNTSSAEPQLGLGGADVVTEELVEGGLTRLAAMFYSEVPDVVGPVRSSRGSDIGIVAPAESALVASGGAPVTVRRLEDAGIPVYTEGAPGFTRTADRESPYDLLLELPQLVEELDDSDPPPAYLPFGANPMQGGKQATAFDVRFSGGHTTSWRYDDGTYVRPDSLAASGDDFAADSVLVLEVRVGNAGYKDPAGNPVPETVYEGSGRARLFHDGLVVDGRWSKPSLDAPLQLSGKAGPLTVPPGNTWIELMPRDDGGVTIG